MIITGGIGEGAIEVTPARLKKKNQSERFVSADVFKQWRASSCLTLQELADYMGVSYQSIQKMERTGLTKTQALAISAIEQGVHPFRAFKSYLSHSQDQEAKENAAVGNPDPKDPD